jgi:uncharacterized protein YegP (UPF0339 family)
MNELSFAIENGADGGFFWSLRAKNKLKIAWSGETYKAKKDCLHGISLLVNGARTAIVMDETGDLRKPLGRADLLFPPGS